MLRCQIRNEEQQRRENLNTTNPHPIPMWSEGPADQERGEMSGMKPRGSSLNACSIVRLYFPVP